MLSWWSGLKGWQQAAVAGSLVAAGVALVWRRNAPADVAEREARWWEGRTEDDPGTWDRLAEYWHAADQPFPGIDEPWSAAFISYTVGHSNRPDALEPSGAHIFYTRAAYWDRGVPGRYGAYRPDEVRVQRGDILVRGRSGVTLTWDDIVRGGDYIPTHGDIVTRVTPTSARIVGGNVGNAVKGRDIELVDGYALSPPYAAVLRLQKGTVAVA